MATAVEPSSTPRTPSARGGLVVASLIGAVYVLAALAVAFYFVPTVWAEHVTPRLGGNTLVDQTLRTAVVVAALVGLWSFGRSLAGANPPKGLRGGIFLTITALCLAFFLSRAVGLRVEGTVGEVIAAAVAVAVLFGAFRLFTSPRGEGWMVSLEEQGWFHGTAYKRVLGRQVRRLTILGILIVGASGVYSLFHQNMLPENWDIAIPFVHNEDGSPKMFRLLPDARFTIPLLLLGLTLWAAWRVVNMPAFAEFLIATEAEMNKVSWSSRRRLFQDTIVVLVCTVFMAVFLLLVDLFWGWLLSREIVGVLPGRNTDQTKAGQVQAARW